MHITIKGQKGSYAQTYAKQKDIPFKVVTLPIANKSSLSADSIVLGKTVTVHCAAKEGTAPYTYAVYYRKAGTDKWSAAQGYNTNATVSIKPAAAADYEIRVIAKDAKGNISRKDMTLTVKKPFTNTSKLNFDTIKLGEKVKIRCFAENGEAPYIFSVQYKKQPLISGRMWLSIVPIIFLSSSPAQQPLTISVLRLNPQMDKLPRKRSLSK